VLLPLDVNSQLLVTKMIVSSLTHNKPSLWIGDKRRIFHFVNLLLHALTLSLFSALRSTSTIRKKE
jgi:hypothetical protein